MKSYAKAQGFFDSPFARCESRFAKADIGPFAEPSVHFGRTLKKLFPLAPEHSELNEVHVLLQKNSSEARKKILIFICDRSRREFLLLVSLLLTTVLSASCKYLVPHLPEAALQIVGLIASFGVITLLFAMMFKRFAELIVIRMHHAVSVGKGL